MLSLSLERSIPPYTFENIFIFIFNYFQEIEENRTVDHVSDLFSKIKDKYSSELDTLSEGDLDSLQTTIMVNINNFIDKNNSKINELAKNPKTEKILPYWIYNLSITIDLLSKALERDFRYISHLKRVSKRFNKAKGEQFENIIFAAFLVFYRILEQNYLLMETHHFDLDRQIDLLIDDVVYLKNIYRMNH